MTQTGLKFRNDYALDSAKISSPPAKPCHNSPNPSFRTSPLQAGEIRNPVNLSDQRSEHLKKVASRGI